MQLGELRRQNLLLILRDLFEGRPSALAKRMGKSAAQISQWKGGHRDIHEDSARAIEQAAGKPAGWMDLVHDNGREGLVTRESVVVLPFRMPRPALRVALEALCEELAKVPEPERREGLGGLMRACAMSGGDVSYIEPILSLLRVRLPEAKTGPSNAV
jgi:transcriptional regulator with XRE-family HTH domain